MPRIAPALLSLVLLLSLAAGCKQEAPTPGGNIAAQLAIPTMAGDTFDPATLHGKPALVVFWRPGCPHCLAELPDAARAARDRGVPAIAVQVSGKPDAARVVLDRSEWTGPALLDDGQLVKGLKIKAVPWTLVLRGDGTAAHAFLGRQSYDTLSSAIASAR